MAVAVIAKALMVIVEAALLEGTCEVVLLQVTMIRVLMVGK